MLLSPVKFCLLEAVGLYIEFASKTWEVLTPRIEIAGSLAINSVTMSGGRSMPCFLLGFANFQYIGIRSLPRVYLPQVLIITPEVHLSLFNLAKPGYSLFFCDIDPAVHFRYSLCVLL